MPDWVVKHGLRCLPGAAGSLGMGCIGFPAHAVYEVTTRCNLGCTHCHVAERPCGRELDSDEARNLLDQFAKVKEFRMTAFTGGEPLLREDLFDLLAHSKSLGFSNTIATNGILVDDRVADELRRSGVSIAAVSLDGDRELHDRIRGRVGAFEAALDGMRALRDAGIVLHVNVTAMGSNISKLEELVQMIETLGAGILLIYQLVRVGRGRTTEERALDAAEHERLIRFMAQVQGNCTAIVEPVAGPQYWAQLIRDSRLGGLIRRPAELLFHGCSAGRGFVYVKPDGEVLPCPFLEASCGNVREKGFSKIWRNSTVLDDLRRREERLKGECGECEYRRLCGGCRGRAMAMAGDYLAHDPSCFIRPSKA